jgi:hypothetical protein
MQDMQPSAVCLAPCFVGIQVKLLHTTLFGSTVIVWHAAVFSQQSKMASMQEGCSVALNVPVRDDASSQMLSHSAGLGNM